MTQPLPADDFDVALPASPYPGLRPFEKHEWAIFFGRETMIDEVVARLIRQQFVVVHGDSGCGKSSLIRAGVLARLEQEHARSGLTWRTCATQPREAPLDLLAAALAEFDGRPGDASRIVEIRRVLNFGADAPSALVRLLRRGDADHICILIDQFEELFAFARRHGPEEARLLVQWLVGLVKAPPPGLYVVLTMRSEFLGMCARFPGLAEAVNDTQYLLPRMAHLDLVRAIREPATLYGGHVAADLAERLIADAGGTQDELPLIQHGLMMLHRRKALPEASIDAAPPDGAARDVWRLELEDLPDESRLRTLLSQHADAVLAGSGGGAVAEQVFRALTEINAEGHPVRRPQTFGALMAVTETDEETLRPFIDAFRRESASFLTPYGGGRLVPGTLIDISHEALMRAWPRIANPKIGWLNAEFQDGLIWRSLLVQAESFETDPSNVLSAATAEARLRWLGGHTAAWAERYGGGWERVSKLVHTSVEAARAADVAEKRRSQRQTLLASAVAALLFALLIVAVVLNRQTSAALRQASTASADTLWNKLDFSGDSNLSDVELNALWEVASGREEVRDAFIEQLGNDPERAALLGRNPGPVLRAIAFHWTPAQATAAFGRIIDAIATTKALDRLELLGKAASAVGSVLPPASRAPGFSSVMSALDKAVELGQRTALIEAAKPVAAEATPIQADALVVLISDVLNDPMAATAIRQRLGRVIPPIAARLTQAQVHNRLSALLKAGLSKTRSVEITPFQAGVEALAVRLTPDQRAAIVTQALSSATNASQSAHVALLVAATRGAAESMAPAQARDLLARALAQVATSTGSADLSGVGEIAEVLARRVGPDGALDALRAVLTVIRDTEKTQTTPLGRVVDVLSGTLTGTNLRDGLATMLAALKATRESSTVNALSAAVGAMAAKTTAPIEAALPILVHAIDTTIDVDACEKLGDAGVSLAGALSPDAAQAALESVLKSVSVSEDRDQLRAFARMAQASTKRLEPRQTQAMIPVIARLLSTGSDGQRGALGLTLEAMAPQLTPEQANTLFQTVLSVARSRDDRSLPEAFESAAVAIAEGLDANQARIAFALVAPILTRTTDSKLRILGSLAASLATHVTPEIARTAFPRLITAIRGTTNSASIQAFAQVAQAVAARLSSADVQTASALVLKALSASSDVDQLAGLKGLLTTLAVRLSPGQAHGEASALIATIGRNEDPVQLVALAGALRGFAAQLSADQALPFVRELLAAIAKATDDDSLAALGDAAEALMARLMERQAQQMATEIGKVPSDTSPARAAALAKAGQGAVGRSSEPHAQAALKAALASVGLLTDKEMLKAQGAAMKAPIDTLSTDAAFPVLSTVVKMMTETSHAARLATLTETAELLAGKLTDVQAQTTLPIVLGPLAGRMQPGQVRALAQTALALSARLPASRGDSVVLAALRAMAGPTGKSSVDDLDKLVRRHTTGWKPQRVEQTLLSLLAWSATESEATLWSTLLIARLHGASPEHVAALTVTALKFPVSAGATTDLLLDGLHAAVPAAPGKAGGLSGTLTWIADTYPSLQPVLTTPPACPVPPGAGLTCPSTKP